MKTIVILSVFALLLSACSKDMPSPDPSPYPVDTTDPGYPSDPGNDDPPPCCYNDHTGSAENSVISLT